MPNLFRHLIIKVTRTPGCLASGVPKQVRHDDGVFWVSNTKGFKPIIMKKVTSGLNAISPPAVSVPSLFLCGYFTAKLRGMYKIRGVIYFDQFFPYRKNH